MRNTHTLRNLWDMYKVDAPALSEALTILANLVTKVSEQQAHIQTSLMNDEYAKPSHDMLLRLDIILSPLNLPVTMLTIVRAKNLLMTKDHWRTFAGFAQLLINIQNVLQDELRSSHVYSLDHKRSEFYEPNIPLFGQKVADNFPSIAYDIDQAGKCYACDLSTASAFHSIRCLEACIKAISRYFGMPDPVGRNRNWGAILKSIRDQIEKKWPDDKSKRSYEYEMIQGIQGALSALQNPYRNKTMHLDAVYTAPDAIHIFEMVKGLIQKTSSVMDENGVLTP